MYLKPKNKKIIATLGLLCSAPLVMAATQVTITDGNPNTEITCQQSGQVGLVVAADGDVTISLSSLDCLQNTDSNVDSDSDGYSDAVEIEEGTDPNNANEIPADIDGDFIPDSTDTDIDGDGYSNTVENAEGTDPNNATEKPADLDGDFIPDSTDTDIDGDGHSNADEIAAGSDPLNPNDVPVVTTPDSLPRESDIVDKFNNDYGSYVNKAQLNPQTLTNGKKVYIVNQGYTATSLPSCVNGKYPQKGCKPTGWTMGMKRNEIFAVRYMTKEDYSTALIRALLNGKSDGVVTQANYKYHISDKPGDMTGGPFPGLCEVTTTRVSGSINITEPNSAYAGYDFYCKIPVNTAFYLNVELADSSLNACDTGICSGYINANRLQNPTNILDGATF